MPDETNLQLNDPKILEAMKRYTDQAVLFGDSETAYRLVRLLPGYLAKTPVESPDFKMAYEEMVLKAKFIALDRLKTEEIAELLQNNFSVLFELGDLFELGIYDLWAKVRAKLVAEPVYTERDEMRKKIREAILASEQILTKEGLILGGVKVKGTVKNWLTDYNHTVGSGKIETLQLAQYETNSPNTKSLSAESRKRLDYLLKFYEKIKLSSLDYDGIEETMVFNINDKPVIFKEGQITKPSREDWEWLDRAKAAVETIELKGVLEEKYRGSEEETKIVEERKAKTLKATMGDFKKLSDLLYEAVNPAPGKAADKIRVEAILKTLAERGELENLLEDKQFNKMMVDHFKEGRTTDLEGFRVNPKGPQYVSVFLQHILKDKIGLGEDESGRIGMQLFNALAKKRGDNKYQGLVYFDMEKKEFKWS